MQRRCFLQAASGALAASALAQTPPRYDIVVKGGDLRDPASQLRRKADLAIADGKIAAIVDDIPAAQSLDTIDARGLYVTPGLVDLHTHCFHGGTGLGVEADPIAARSGVTTWVDAGSFAWDTTAGFRRFVVQPQQARIFGFVYLYPSSRDPSVDPVQYVRRQMRQTGETAVANRDIILGVKFQVGSNMNGRYSLRLPEDCARTLRQVPPAVDGAHQLCAAGDRSGDGTDAAGRCGDPHL